MPALPGTTNGSAKLVKREPWTLKRVEPVAPLDNFSRTARLSSKRALLQPNKRDWLDLPSV
jgi:hypothetical protein